MEDTRQIEEPTKNEEIKIFSLVEYTTFIYALLTFLGYSYLDAFYRFWHITIYSFLDASEILLAFLNNIHITVFTIIFGFILYSIPLYYITPLARNLRHREIIKPKNKEYYLKKYSKLLLSL